MNNTPNTTKDSQSIVYTYVNWLTLSMKDWISAINGQLSVLKFPGEPAFHTFKALTLIRQIEQDPNSKYRQNFQQMIQNRLTNWQTIFQNFTKTTNWKIHEFSGMTFWLAFPLLGLFNNFPCGFADFILAMFVEVWNLQKDSIASVPMPLKTPFQLYLISDKSGSVYLFSSGAAVHSMSPWLSFQMAFLLYNLFPMNKAGTHSTELKPFNRLTWFWSETMMYSLLDLPPTFKANSLGQMITFDKFMDPDIGPNMNFLFYLGEVYNKKNSVALNNLYEWLQCVISSVPEEPIKVYGYKPEALMTFNSLVPKVSLVAAITNSEITPEILESLMKSIPQPH